METQKKLLVERVSLLVCVDSFTSYIHMRTTWGGLALQWHVLCHDASYLRIHVSLHKEFLLLLYLDGQDLHMCTLR